jgi:predicted dehydrogenase
MTFLKYKKGTVANVVVSFTVTTVPTNSIEVYGTEGTILENHSWQNPVKIFSKSEEMGKNKNMWYEPEIEHSPYPVYYEISSRIEDEYFTNCILEDKDPEFTPEDARAAIATILMGYLSAKEGKTITYDDLMHVYKTKGTKSILIGLENYVINNYCVE